MSHGLDSTTAHDFLMGRVNYERTPKDLKRLSLERMEQLAELLGNPQNELPIVHVAGSKGKGSTATFIAQILQAAGRKVGLYTSPHLTRIEERIAINGQPCAPWRFAGLVNKIMPAVDKMDDAARREGTHRGPTFFEIVTAAAWLQFAAAKVDVAVMEVGLGGRLDSTNVCHPAVSVITSISRDHTRQLGNTLAQIAGEKAGIIKPGVPVVSGVTHPEAADVIQRVGREQNCAVYWVDHDFHYQLDESTSEDTTAASIAPLPRTRFHYQDCFGQRFERLEVAMLGNHQATNAAVAIATVAVLNQRLRNDSRFPAMQVDQRAIRQGLANARLPGRVELLSPPGELPLVVIDGAHNDSSIAALIAALDRVCQYRHQACRKRVIFATTRGKDTEGMLRALANWADELVLTRYVKNPRGVSVADLQSTINQLDHSQAVVCTADNTSGKLRWPRTCFASPAPCSSPPSCAIACWPTWPAAPVLRA
jgi:dihydrofolate synthase/folylpolyglutamate synthase